MSDGAPLILSEANALEIGYVTDLYKLLQAIDETMPKDAVVYVEATAIAPDVAFFLEMRSAQGMRQIKPNTLWPRPRVFHMPLTGENLAEFRNLAEKHAEPEVADHLVVYRGEDVLLWAPDAGNGYVYVARDLSESIVEAFRDALGDAPRDAS